jgi:hypothetical protein
MPDSFRSSTRACMDLSRRFNLSAEKPADSGSVFGQGEFWADAMLTLKKKNSYERIENIFLHILTNIQNNGPKFLASVLTFFCRGIAVEIVVDFFGRH